MAIVKNPRKNFNFNVRVSTPFFNAFEVQEVDSPDTEIDVVEHGETNHVIKTGGQIKYSTGKIRGIIDAKPGALDWVWRWIKDVQNVDIGGGLIPSFYKKTLTLEYLDVNGITVIETEIWEGAWPSKLNGKQLRRIGSENIMNDLELCVDKVIKV
jgi:hypothetical protein